MGGFTLHLREVVGRPDHVRGAEHAGGCDPVLRAGAVCGGFGQAAWLLWRDSGGTPGRPRLSFGGSHGGAARVHGAGLLSPACMLASSRSSKHIVFVASAMLLSQWASH